MNIENAKPILFNTEMVRAILDGRKTVTRRTIKQQPDYFFNCVCGEPKPIGKKYGAVKDGNDIYIAAPYKTGDILYVRETWRSTGEIARPYAYKADEKDFRLIGESGQIMTFRYRWRQSIHMPKEAARIFLRVTNMRVERLQEISDNDVIREGINPSAWNEECCGSFSNESCENRDDYGRLCYWFKFSELWDSTIKPSDRDRYGWNANPWVWVIEFERMNRNG